MFELVYADIDAFVLMSCLLLLYSCVLVFSAAFTKAKWRTAGLWVIRVLGVFTGALVATLGAFVSAGIFPDLDRAVGLTILFGGLLLEIGSLHLTGILKTR